MLLHQVDQVGAAGDEFRPWIAGDLGHRVGDVVGPRVSEIYHCCPIACWIAATMLGYAPQRQMLPLMSSRISSGAPRLALGDQAHGRTDLSRRAVAALERIVIDERLLQRMQCAIRRQSFDGRHVGTVVHDGERETGIDPPPIHQHGARAALAVIASLLGAGKVEMVAQRIEQSRPRRDTKLRVDAVYDQRHRKLLWRAGSRHSNLHMVCTSSMGAILMFGRAPG